MIEKSQLNQNFDQYQHALLILRRVQLAICSFILFFILCQIIYKRFYLYKTIKMFWLVCFCYFVSMVAALCHTTSLTANRAYAYQQQQPTIQSILNQMRDQQSLALCGGQAFFNIYFYNIGYFFAVLITYNVYCVATSAHREFSKNTGRNPKVIIFFFIMTILYVLPFIFMFIQNFLSSYFYSYGPDGLTFEQNGKRAQLLLFCGISFAPQFKWSALANIYICPVILLVIHLYYLCCNRQKVNPLFQQEYLNSKQKFIINSGRISLIVFSVQLFNIIKLVFAQTIKIQSINIVFNFIYDLYPIVYFVFYKKYTKQVQVVEHGSSTIYDE